MFDRWADSVVKEYEHTSTGNVRELPGFNFCVVVDKRCSESFEKSEVGGDGKKTPVFVMLMRAERGVPVWVLEAQAAASQRLGSGVDSENKEEDISKDEGEEKEEKEEGDDIPLVGPQATCMYVETRHLLSLYNSLHTDSVWENFYVRLLRVYGRNEV